MKCRLLILIILAIAAGAFAQGGGIAIPGAFDPGAQAKVTIEGSIAERSGQSVRGEIVAKVAPGWHINSIKPLDEFLIPTELTLDPATADLVDAQFPPHLLRSFGFSAGKELAVYEGDVRIPFSATLKSGASSIGVKLRYQACDDQVCLPPKTATTTIPLDGSVAPAPAGGGSGFVPIASAPKDAVPVKKSLFSSDVGGTLASRGLPLTLLAIFVLGLALNLTPCVYPLIPITIGYFSSQSGESRGHRVALSVVYVTGLALTYSALGVFSALSGRLFGAWLQLPAVLIFFAVLMLVMASSMFGLFEITVPHFITDRSGGRAGLAGAFSMGLLIGIVAAPCVGPFVISLIALVSQIGSPMLGFLMFFVLALGLGVPYLILGIFSSAMAAVPRSGMWMVQVKKAMGFVLIAMAFYFLRPLLGEDWFRWGVAASLLVGAIYLFLSRSQGARVLRFACAALLLVGGAAFAIPRQAGATVRWDRYDTKALDAASTANKPVVIDFYADWCLPCKELDEKTFSDPAVAKELQRFIRVKADLTMMDSPESQDLVKKHAVLGVPTIVFLNSDGSENQTARLIGFEGPEKFLARLQQVR